MRWIRRVVIALGVLAGWVIVSAIIMVSTELSPGALIPFPSQTLLRNLPGDVRIVDWRPHRLVVTSDQPGYVQRLYRHGARFVLPARKNGCLDRTVRIAGGRVRLPVR